MGLALPWVQLGWPPKLQFGRPSDPQTTSNHVSGTRPLTKGRGKKTTQPSMLLTGGRGLTTNLPFHLNCAGRGVKNQTSEAACCNICRGKGGGGMGEGGTWCPDPASSGCPSSFPGKSPSRPSPSRAPRRLGEPFSHPQHQPHRPLHLGPERDVQGGAEGGRVPRPSSAKL